MSFNVGAASIGWDGLVYFGGVNGLNVFNPSRFRDNSFIPPIVISAFRIFDQPVRPDEMIDEYGVLTLSYRQNFFSFEFAALDFTIPEKNAYAYMLEGFDKGWIYSGTRRYASYTNLDGGHYRFRVKGCNNDGVWNEAGAAVPIHIIGPLWLSWWANIAYASLALLLLYGTIRFKTQSQARKLTEQLRSMTHELTLTLELNVVMTRLLENLASVIPYERATVLLRNDHQEYEPKAATGATDLPPIPKKYQARFIEEIERSGECLIIEDVNEFFQWPGNEKDVWIHTLLGIPLTVGDEVPGMVLMYHRHPDAFKKDLISLAATMVNQASFAVENARLFEKIRKMAIIDGLTGLFNRRHFFQLAAEEFIRAKRYNHALSVIMLDVDHFKKVNDNHGHAIGDEVLRVVATECGLCLRANDLMGRYGGEEFVILLPESAEEMALSVAERLRVRLADYQGEEHEPPLPPMTASFGVATREPTTRSIESLIDKADKALYQAKQNGRNRVEISRDNPTG